MPNQDSPTSLPSIVAALADIQPGKTGIAGVNVASYLMVARTRLDEFVFSLRQIVAMTALDDANAAKLAALIARLA